MRNATAYGASPRLRLDIVLNDFVAAAFTTGKILIKSDGTPWRPIVHIRDIIGAIVSVLKAPREAVHNQTFNVGQTEENYRIRDLATIVTETVPGSRVEYAADGGPDKRCYRVNCEKIRRLVPSFQPQWSARKGAQELYESYRTAALKATDIQRYIRLNQIQKLINSGQLDSSLHWIGQHAETAAVS
jgi:nucleoside-diphosphate-sugar epimerase